MNARLDYFFKQARGIKSRANRCAVQDIIVAAAQNANDTIYTEKAAPESDWLSLFEGSIGVLLSDGVDKNVSGFFLKRGIRY